MFLFKREFHLKHKGTENIETKRFLLRKFQKYDVNDIYNNWTSDKEAAKYNAWEVHDSLSVTREYLAEWIIGYEKQNYYHWAIADKLTEEVIGSISVSNIKHSNRYCEIGYTIARKYWNHGIATEVLIEVIKFLMNNVGFNNIHAIHDVRNKASGRVMENAGMTYVKNKKKFFLNSEKFIMDCSIYKYKI